MAKKKEKVKEIFELDDGEKEVVIEEEGELEKERAKKGQVKEEKNILRGFLVVIGIGIILISFLAGYSLLKSNISNFEVEGVKYTIIKEGNMLFYNTKLALYQNDKYFGDYNFYLRNDPRKLMKEIPFQGKMELYKTAYINLTNDFNCDGDAVIAGANLMNQFGVMGMNLTRSEDFKCIGDGKYMHINVLLSPKTSIVEKGVGCYTIYVSECKILPALERFMVEVFTRHREKINLLNSGKPVSISTKPSN